MKIVVSHINQQFERNRQQHVFADELAVKVQRVRECILGNTLPVPTATLIAAWNDLPNITVDKLPKYVQNGRVIPRAPQPTPTKFASNASDATLTDRSSDGGHDQNDDWLLVEDTTSSAPDVAVLRNLESPAPSEGDWKPKYTYPNQPLDQRAREEDPIQSPSNDSSSSEYESLSSSSGSSPVPVGFHNTVNQWLLDYRARGTDAFIESLIAFGVVSVGTARLASRIARAIVKRVAKLSYTEGKNLEDTIRFTALATFKNYWEWNDTWMEASSPQADMQPTTYGINIASLMGSFFHEKLSTVKDVHLCLSLLSEGEKRFDRLCAMHALLAQANDKLCKNRNLQALMQFRDGITSVTKDSGEYLWATTPHSKMILVDILAIIDRWLVTQAIKREQSRESSRRTGHHTVRNSAVGPRLRTRNGAGL